MNLAECRDTSFGLIRNEWLLIHSQLVLKQNNPKRIICEQGEGNPKGVVSMANDLKEIFLLFERAR